MKMRRFDVCVGRAVAGIGVVYVFLATLLHVPLVEERRGGKAPFREPLFGRSSRMPVAVRWGRSSSPESSGSSTS